MSFKVQLAHNVAMNRVQNLVHDDRYYFEQKLDGHRRAIQIDDGVVIGWNRSGGPADVDPRIAAALADVKGHWIVDGEWIDGVFWAFDLPEAPGIDVRSPYSTRRMGLAVIAPKLTELTPLIRLLPTHITPESKVALFKWVAENNGEGVMIKDATAPYTCGLRSDGTLKAKFTATVDVVVLIVGREGKRSIAVGLYDANGKMVDVGSCTVQDEHLTILKVGDVVEIKYLYATADRRLYQPRFKTLRDDKPASECTIDQLKVTSKEVLADPL